VVLGDAHGVEVGENGFHHLRIAGHFLFVPRLELSDFDIGEKLLDLRVREFAADPGSS
jgi:hypothetical protein